MHGGLDLSYARALETSGSLLFDPALRWERVADGEYRAVSLLFRKMKSWSQSVSRRVTERCVVGTTWLICLVAADTPL
ncbi:hypothetical protein SKAU_G00325500 [Synaphobranchus kaupii]|uniref:Uncharacterized protein n=1 Tax=Synaphobranchus kaupii TaxID=118154 RepID=A0A9Q1EPN2_SYNKA|nr:hypothetical protein SKAU_G00325500 [Synaphobranchus kaupii]